MKPRRPRKKDAAGNHSAEGTTGVPTRTRRESGHDGTGAGNDEDPRFLGGLAWSRLSESNRRPSHYEHDRSHQVPGCSGCSRCGWCRGSGLVREGGTTGVPSAKVVHRPDSGAEKSTSRFGQGSRPRTLGHRMSGRTYLDHVTTSGLDRFSTSSDRCPPGVMVRARPTSGRRRQGRGGGGARRARYEPGARGSLPERPPAAGARAEGPP